MANATPDSRTPRRLTIAISARMARQGQSVRLQPGTADTSAPDASGDADRDDEHVIDH